MNEKIRIGTSGWSFQDWKGVFYPDNLSDSDLLPFYSQHFTCTEVNSTYYKIPHMKVFEHLADKTPDKFEFMVKFNRETTHGGNNPVKAMNDLNEAIIPLKEASKFSGFLGQFPYSFKNREANRKLLHQIRETLPDDPIFVEFRHDSWATDALYKFLTTNELGYVCVDEPQLRGLIPPQTITTTQTGYCRLHGRNKETWWNPEAGDRYDYSYSDEELKEWIERINQMQNRVSKLYIFFNNCHHGQAPLNAKSMMNLFEQR